MPGKGLESERPRGDSLLLPTFILDLSRSCSLCLLATADRFQSVWQIPRTRAHIVIVEESLKSPISRPVFGPPMADADSTHPLGKTVCIRIDRKCVVP